MAPAAAGPRPAPADVPRTACRTGCHPRAAYNCDQIHRAGTRRRIAVGGHGIHIRRDRRRQTRHALRAQRLGVGQHVAHPHAVAAVVGLQHDPVAAVGARDHPQRQWHVRAGNSSTAREAAAKSTWGSLMRPPAGDGTVAPRGNQVCAGRRLRRGALDLGRSRRRRRGRHDRHCEVVGGVPGDGQRQQQQGAGDQEGRARQVPGGEGTDRGGEHLRVQGRTPDAGETLRAGEGALQAPLFVRIDLARGDGLRGGPAKPWGQEGNRGEEQPAHRRQSLQQKPIAPKDRPSMSMRTGPRRGADAESAAPAPRCCSRPPGPAPDPRPAPSSRSGSRRRSTNTVLST